MAKVNAVISEDTREVIRSMALTHGATVQKIVAMLIGHALRHMTTKEVKRALQSQNGDGKQYRRTKPFLN